jgi:hypothetical protein
MANQPLNAEQVNNLIQAALQAQEQANQAQQQALQQQIQQLQAQAGQPPAAGPFSLSPALANANNVIDYTTTAGSKLFNKATDELPTQFSLNEPNPRVLIEELKVRSSNMAWGNIMEVNVGDANNPVNRNMLTNHGEISSDKCKATSATYLNTDSRRTQNNYQLYLCLTKSVDADTIEKMSDESEKYTVTIPGANNAPATTHSCGVCYLKLLLAKAEVDNKAVASHVRTNLSKLDQYMVSEAKSNITKFNEYVRKQLRILSQRGEESSDTLTNLFKGYLACNDKDFVADIKRIKRDHDFGERELTPKTLMDRAQEMYDTAGLEETWEELTEEQQELVAL